MGVSSNGKTLDFGPSYLGSIPSTPTNFMQRKYKGAQRIALIRKEVEEAIEEIEKLPVQIDLHPYWWIASPYAWLGVYRLACEHGALALADKVKLALSKKFGDKTVERALEFSARYRG